MIRLGLCIALALAVQPAWALSVSITATVEGGDKPTIVGKTNLPNGTELMVTLSRKESSYMAQDKTIVSDGRFRAGPFSQRGAPLNPGVYQIEVSSPLAALQPQSVRAVIGQDGGKLDGPFTKRSQFGGKVVEYRTTTKIGAAPISAEKDRGARDQAKKDTHEWWLQSCKDNCNVVKRYAASRNEAFDWDRCYQKCLADEPKR